MVNKTIAEIRESNSTLTTIILCVTLISSIIAVYNIKQKMDIFRQQNTSELSLYRNICNFMVIIYILLIFLCLILLYIRFFSPSSDVNPKSPTMWRIMNIAKGVFDFTKSSTQLVILIWLIFVIMTLLSYYVENNTQNLIKNRMVTYSALVALIIITILVFLKYRGTNEYNIKYNSPISKLTRTTAGIVSTTTPYITKGISGTISGLNAVTSGIGRLGRSLTAKTNSDVGQQTTPPILPTLPREDWLSEISYKTM